MPWDPKLYDQYQNERSQPFYDLIGLIQNKDMINKVVDLGCGSGRLTKELLPLLPNAEILGIDRSPQMLSNAVEYAVERLSFVQGEQTMLSGDWDLIISNASLQWSENHRELLPKLFDHLTPTGQLLIQMPANHQSPIHQYIRELATQTPFKDQLGGYNRVSPVLSIEEYAEILFRISGNNFEIFEKIYPHVLSSHEDILEWIKGTALIPYKEKFTTEQFALYASELLSHFKVHYQTTPIFYPFKRLFISTFKGS